MESKMLSIRSFEKNQTLLSFINKIIIDTRLQSHGVDNNERREEVAEARQGLMQFLESILEVTSGDLQGNKVLTGMDSRDRAFVRSFIEAKKRPQKFHSILFKGSPRKVIDLLKSSSPEDPDLLEALTDLRNLIEEHVSLDVKGLVGDF